MRILLRVRPRWSEGRWIPAPVPKVSYSEIRIRELETFVPRRVSSPFTPRLVSAVARTIWILPPAVERLQLAGARGWLGSLTEASEKSCSPACDDSARYGECTREEGRS